MKGRADSGACTHLGGPYNYHDIDIVGDAVYTNNPPNGAFILIDADTSSTAGVGFIAAAAPSPADALV